jgi:hypothetical protein
MRLAMYNQRQNWALRIVLGVTALLCVIFLAL